jgi:hypothetical protein
VESLLNSSLKLGHFSIYRGPWYGPHWVEVEGLLPYTREPTSEEWETRLAPISVARVSEIMTEFVVACDSAARELKQLEMGDFFALGGAWREMVERVATFYNARGYKATARNDRGVRTPPSDFTRLINTIQFQLPEKFRRHHRASTAEMAGTPLESAIAKVLAACKRERKRASTDMPIIES